jgi:uncharacterized membrane protein YadS
VAEDLKLPGWWLGIGLAAFVSVSAGYIAHWFGVSILGFTKSPVSAIMMAIILGMLVANTIRLPESIQPGLKFCASGVLRVGIMLLGIRLSLTGAGQFTLVALPFVIAAIAIGLFLGTSIRETAERCLLVAMAAVGLTSMFAGIIKIGMRPFALGLFAAVLIGGVSFALISLFGASLIALLV